MAGLPPDPEFSDVEAGASSTAARTYRVAPGDTLSGIARRCYGDAGLWPVIHAANADLIADPDLIQAGWTLTIPPRP